MKKLLITLAVICAMLVPVATAQAEKIDRWTATTVVAYDNMNFVSGSYPPGYSATYEHTVGGKKLYSYYRWGETNPPNALSGGSFGPYYLNTGQSDGRRAYSYVTNNPVPITSTALKSGDVVIGTTLKHNSMSEAYEIVTTLHFGYFETLNRPDGTKSDVFFITDKWLAEATTPHTFTVGDHVYEFKLTVEGDHLEKLTGAALNTAKSQISSYDYNSVIYGMIIPEAISYSLFYNVEVIYKGPKTPVVPIPGAVWLMGTGLAGLVAVRRRQKKS